MKIVLDASMALAWHLQRTDHDEAVLAQRALQSVTIHGALVPALWYPEVGNGLLVAERRRITDEYQIVLFRADLAQLSISMDTATPDTTLSSVLALGRSSKLTGYDATYLELVLRVGGVLATFDRQLAEAVRTAGVRVFGDAA